MSAVIFDVDFGSRLDEDNASLPHSHTARNTLAYLRRENVTFIEPDIWPPNNPDLNPVDYAV